MLNSVVLCILVGRPQSELKQLPEPVANREVSKNGEGAVGFNSYLLRPQNWQESVFREDSF